MYFQLFPSQVVGIVGESGSGKTLTSLAIIGLLPEIKTIKQEGHIQYMQRNGVSADMLDTKHVNMNRIRGNEISMIFQDPLSSLNPSIRCGNQASEPLRHHFKLKKKEAKKRIIELFAKVALPDPEKVYNSYPHQLSGGQRQRVMIAMAMSTKPRILIADEPTTALDVTVQKEIIQLLNTLKEESETAIVFISHDLALVSNIADYIVVMQHGKVVEQGPSASIFANPKAPYTKALMACRPQLTNNPLRLPTVNDFLNNDSISKPINDLAKEPSDLLVGDKILSIENLSVHYALGRRNKQKADAWFRANDQISLNLFQGETLGLVGESGCGKSTLIRAALQLIRPTSGSVVFDGCDLTSLSERELRKYRTRLQIVFQDPYSSLTPHRSVKDALLEPMNQHRVLGSQRLDYAVYILEKTGLSADDLKKYPHQFSGGQRQRIVIARALVLKPEIVFCDESVSALDVSVQAQVLNLFNDLKDEFGLTYVFISHDMNVVGYMSNRIVVMQKGKIVESGIAKEIISNPQNAYTQTLIESIPKVVL